VAISVWYIGVSGQRIDSRFHPAIPEVLGVFESNPPSHSICPNHVLICCFISAFHIPAKCAVGRVPHRHGRFKLSTYFSLSSAFFIYLALPHRPHGIEDITRNRDKNHVLISVLDHINVYCLLLTPTTHQPHTRHPHSIIK
jgi:hypothetical protein